MYVGPDDPIFAGRFPGRGGMGGEMPLPASMCRWPAITSCHWMSPVRLCHTVSQPKDSPSISISVSMLAAQVPSCARCVGSLSITLDRLCAS